MSEATKHTKGPWKIGYGGMDGDQFFTIVSDHAPKKRDGFSRIAEYGSDEMDAGELQANARLIAAAPDLLAAAKAVSESCTGDMPPSLSSISDLRDAIAKATEGTPK